LEEYRIGIKEWLNGEGGEVVLDRSLHIIV